MNGRGISAAVAAVVLGVALAVPAAWAAVAKNKLDVEPIVFRTHVRMAAFYEIQPDASWERICENDPPSLARLCGRIEDEWAQLTLTIRRNGRIVYDETKEGTHGTWEQRVTFRELQRETGPKCQAGAYHWILVMRDPIVRDGGLGQTVARRGRFNLRCERGQLVATPNV